MLRSSSRPPLDLSDASGMAMDMASGEIVPMRLVYGTLRVALHVEAGETALAISGIGAMSL